MSNERAVRASARNGPGARNREASPVPKRRKEDSVVSEESDVGEVDDVVEGGSSVVEKNTRGIGRLTEQVTALFKLFNERLPERKGMSWGGLEYEVEFLFLFLARQ